MLRVRQGDHDAFASLVRRYQPRANAVAYRLLNHREDAMEIVQDAFLKAYRSIESLQSPERFGSWLLRIVSNLSLNRRRSRALRKSLSLDAPRDHTDQADSHDRPDPRQHSPLAEAIGSDLQDALQDAIDALPDAQRLALVLFSLEEMPQKDIAHILDCSVEAVKWNVFAARKSLRATLEERLS